jgi:hypothetical protein
MPLPPTNSDELPEYAGCNSLAEAMVVTTAVDGIEMLQTVLDGVGFDRQTLRKIAAELEQGGADEIAALVRAQIPKAKLREPEWVTARKKRERARRKVMLAAFHKMTGKAD